MRGAVVVWGENEACQTLPERTTTTACIIIKMFVLVLTTCQARGSTSIPGEDKLNSPWLRNGASAVTAPILWMRKLRHKRLENLPKVAQ